MNNSITTEELLMRYREVCNREIKKFQEIDTPIARTYQEVIGKCFSLDLQSVIELYKDIELSECFIGEQRKWDDYAVKYTIDPAKKIIEEGKTVAYFDNNDCQIISENKKVKMHMYAISHPSNNVRRANRIEVTQITKEGVYNLILDPYEKTVKLFYCLNEGIKPLADNRGCTVEEHKYDFLHNNNSPYQPSIGLREIYNSRMINLNINLDDIPTIANMLFKTDISALCKKAYEFTANAPRRYDVFQEDTTSYIDANKYFKVPNNIKELFKLSQQEEALIQNVTYSLEQEAKERIENQTMSL